MRTKDHAEDDRRRTQGEERPFPTEEEIAKTIVEEPAVEKAPEPTTAVVSTPSATSSSRLTSTTANKKDAKPAGATSAVRSAHRPVDGRRGSRVVDDGVGVSLQSQPGEGEERDGGRAGDRGWEGGVGGARGLVNKGRGDANGKTSEADLASLVAHCVRHAKRRARALARAGRRRAARGIKDILLRLTGETFSENTILVTIERVRRVGGTVGSEVAQLADDGGVQAAERSGHEEAQALPERTPHTMTA